MVYQRYAARKPIMICEYGATHYCKADGRPMPGFCAGKMQMLYSALPRRFPRVKAIHWFNLDNTTHRVRAGRDINNFSLTDDAQVVAAYREAIRSPYFLTRVQTGRTQDAGVRYDALADGNTLSGTVRLSALADTYSDRPVVGYRLDGAGQVAVAGRPYEVEWDTTRVANGTHTLETLVFVGGRVATRRAVKVRVTN